MAGLLIPADVPALPTMTSLPSGAVDLEGDLRAALVGAKDVQAWAEGVSADAFAGDAADASTHALTRFSRRLDTTEAALEAAVLAAARFEDRLARLVTERVTLEADRAALNADLADLRVAAAAAAPDDVALLRIRATRLERRSHRLVDDIARWALGCTDAESDFVAALARVDTVGEGRAVAADPHRVDPDAVLALLGIRRGDPGRVARWWRGLSRAQRQAVLAEHPQVVGALGGVPVRDRDAANRAEVAADLDELSAKARTGEVLTAAERDRWANASHVRDVLADYAEEVDPVTGEELALVALYRPDEHSGDGGVALFIGDPDRAEHVAVYVPGTLSETGTLAGSLDNIDALRRHVGDLAPESVAVGLWLDYDAPSIDGLSPAELWDLGSVVMPGEAAAGGHDLADYLDGLRASDEGEPAHLSLIGHSYGATTASYAALDGAPVDDLALLGSPGAPTVTAAGLTSAEVHVGAADHDPVSLLGGSGPWPGPLGHDPAQATFGARRFEVDAGSYRVQDLIANHSSYFRDESLEHLGEIVVGETPDTVPGRVPFGYQTLDQLIAGSSLASGGEWLWEVGEHAVGGLTGTVHDLAEGLVGLPQAVLPGGRP